MNVDHVEHVIRARKQVLNVHYVQKNRTLVISTAYNFLTKALFENA